MIILYRTDGDSRSDEIQSRLEDLVAAHQVASASEARLSDEELPAIKEGDRLYLGDEIEPFLLGLERDLSASRQVSADACYVDPDDPSRCV